ncbi:MAG: TetR/AcrR family transcriptional regulator [Puniceicoccaceae bacterium]|nr:MAG: TetR/AcrR family transcriptional regulator [Puniceicoccaceae bacterium]
MELYRNYLLEEGRAPASVFAFCRLAKLGEETFYDHFPSLEGLEARIWEQLVVETEETLAADEDYAGYGARQRVLAFFFTFLEVARAQRSFLLLRFPGWKPGPGQRRLRRFRERFQGFAREVVKAGVEAEEIADCARAEDWMPRVLYAQLLGVISFYLEDESDRFERTDALVEKSVRLTFEIAEAEVLDAALDLVRFLAGRGR